MTAFLFLLLLLLRSSGSEAQVLTFDKTLIKFGFVHEGEIVSLSYSFRNTGDKPLVFSNYDVECDCTVVELPAVPVMPGESGIINVRFNTKNKYDRQDRIVTISSNAQNSPSVIRFKGVVLKPRG